MPGWRAQQSQETSPKPQRRERSRCKHRRTHPQQSPIRKPHAPQAVPIPHAPPAHAAKGLHPRSHRSRRSTAPAREPARLEFHQRPFRILGPPPRKSSRRPRRQTPRPSCFTAQAPADSHMVCFLRHSCLSRSGYLRVFAVTATARDGNHNSSVLGHD